MSEKFADLTIEELEASIVVFEMAQLRIVGEDRALQNQIDELKQELENRRKPLNEKVLIKG